MGGRPLGEGAELILHDPLANYARIALPELQKGDTDFGLTTHNTNTVTHTAQPSAESYSASDREESGGQVFLSACR